MMRMTIISLSTVLILYTGTSKEIYKVSFSSTGNIIELTVENASSLMANDIQVKPVNLPTWIRMNVTEITFDHVKPGSAKTANFTFSVDKTAPINSEQTLRFTVTSQAKEEWTKEISISVAPPEKFELFQNYPNPFNPTTTFDYILPNESKVTLVIYDVLGKEIATLVDEVQGAGYHERTWNAANIASGVYFFRASYVDRQGIKQFEQKRLLLMK